MNEPPLFDRAIAALTAQGLEVCVTDPPEMATQVGADAWLRVGKGGEQADYAAMVQRKLTPTTLGAATVQLRHVANATGHPALLVTDYLTPPMAERLRDQKQQFADAAGNAYLEGPGLLVYVTGRKLLDKRIAPNAGKAYTLTGLKVMLALLCDPALADAPQRAIAAAAGVALGAIPAVLADLQQTGHLLVLAKRRRLNATKRLLDEWALAYARRLRAKTLHATYAVKDFDAWQQWPLDAQVLWGGEPAANLLVQYLKPGVLTIYADRLPPKLLMEQRMTIVRGAQVGDRVLEWRKPFWGNVPVTTRPNTVHPVLVYADLLATGDARCIETAQLVYDEYLARLLPAA
ncbi:type IV toxin-antitoxin system AbiEi family antitoxin [Polaromonas sp. P1-6]|nr:type IV toxin-antitoxin system AbiEi family antitoxin [Polaromonas sp. P1-6]